MKKLNLLFVFVFIFNQAFAQDANMDLERQNNQVLRDNAIKGDVNKQKEESPLTFFKPSGQVKNANGQVDPSTLNLTDQERQLSQSFVHQGKANRIVEENCKGDMEKACAGNAPDTKFMGMNSGMIQAVSKAYAMFGMMGGDSSFLGLEKKAEAPKTGEASGQQAQTTGQTPTTKPDAAKPGEAGKPTEKKGDKGEDYCKYIPMGVEAVAAYQSKQSSDKLTEKPLPKDSTAQKEALLRAAKSHDDRAEGAKIQSMGWMGTAACYTYMATAGGYAMNTGMIVKLGSAAFLGMVYNNEVEANEEYAKKTRAIAALLPSPGDCNPITDNTCYCSQPETQNDPKYCRPQLHNKMITAGSNDIRTSCINSELKADPKCSCEANQSCLEKFIQGKDITNTLGFSSIGGSPFKPLYNLAHGTLEGGKLGTVGTKNLSAIAKKGLQMASGKIPVGDLNADQKNMAKAMANSGLPDDVAAIIATTAVPKSEMDKALSKLKGSNFGAYGAASAQYAKYYPTQNNGGTFGGMGLKAGAGSNKAAAAPFSFQLPGKKGAEVSQQKILDYTEKAQKQNQITKTEASIFEVISNRYAESARRRLELEEN